MIKVDQEEKDVFSLEIRDQWNYLHKWAENFRKEHCITVLQFLKFFGLPTQDAFRIYLYPDKYNCVVAPRNGSVAEELLRGLKIVYLKRCECKYYTFEEADEMEKILDAYEMNRAFLREENITYCFFEKLEKIHVECLYIKGTNFVQSRAEALLYKIFGGDCTFEYNEIE